MNRGHLFAGWILAAVALTPAAIDALLLARSWRQLQNRADGISQSAMLARADGRSAREGVDRVLQGLAPRGEAVSYSIEYPPRAGRFTGSPDAMRVTARAVRSPPFSAILGWRYSLEAEGTAAILRRSDECTRARVLRVA